MSIYLFRLAEGLWSPREGLLAVAILQTIPLMYGMSRQFLVDYGLATLVVMWIYYFHLRPVSGVWSTVRLGVLLGLGLLMKATFPLYIGAPAAVQAILAIRACRGWHDKAMTIGRFGCILLVGGLIASVWYLPNWLSVTAFARSASNGKLSINYGSSDVFSPRVVLDYFVQLSSGAVSTWYAFLLLIAAAAWLLLPKRAGFSCGSLVWLLAAWAASFAITTFSVNKSLRYVAPLLPVAALWLARTVIVFCPPRRLVAASALLLTVPAFAYACSSFPFGARIPEFAVGRFRVWSPHLWHYAAAPGDGGAWHQAEIISAICHGPESPQEGDRLLVLLSHQYLNNENLGYLTLKAGCRLQVVGVPGEITTSEQLKGWIDQVRPKYVLIVPQVSEPELAPPFANTMKGEAERLVTSDPAFQQIHRGVLGATGAEYLIYRRL
jgi:4-amino-4-deoxy-L-arabinose transferase-like glycosyltransferase